jgi:very-short-patch-repair endonuclease
VTDQAAAAAGALGRARNLFRFLKAFAERNIPVHRTLAQHAWTFVLRDLPVHPSVSLVEVLVADPTADAPDEETPPLLRVARPKLTRAPEPPPILREHLGPGWDRADGAIKVHPVRNVVRAGETVTEQFEDDPARVVALAEWRTRWNVWADAERPALAAMRLFERLYELHGRIERESEQVELMLGDGRLRWKPAGGAAVDHPILLQRVELHFDPNVPEFTVADAERAPELYGALISEGTELSPAKLNELRSELEKGGYHPLAREATSGYLRKLVQLLGAHGSFHETRMPAAAGPDPVIARDAVLFLRIRPTGYPAAFDRVLQDLETRQSLPEALTRLVGVEPPRPPEAVEHTASPWGEPPDVLLSKPANVEQVQIARALERHRAILVQGPPGTGKSHTISNLIGHLVAQGKRVLVTSHTTKALRVLRDQVVPELQPLCVAVLENDADSRGQMEQSVRGILSRITTSNPEQLAHEVAELTTQRQALNNEITRITVDLRVVREAEYTPIVIAGVSTPPAEAARWVEQNADANNWIPGPFTAGAPLPLSDDDLRALYETTRLIDRSDEAEMDAGIPGPDTLPTPAQFAALASDVAATEPPELSVFWERPAAEEESAALGALLGRVRAAAAELGRLESWQRAIVAAGHAGGTEAGLWQELGRQVAVAVDAWRRARPLLLDHDVQMPPELESDETRRTINEIGTYVANGGSLGRWTLLTKGSWKAVLRGTRVDGAEPRTVAHFKAITAHLAVQEARRRLSVRWTKQAVPIGLPPFSGLGTAPEPILRDYAGQFDELLAWWPTRWKSIEAAASAAGFRWIEFRRRDVARAAPAAPFDRDVSILNGPLPEVIAARSGVAARSRAQRILGGLDHTLAGHKSGVARKLRTAVRECNTPAYGEALEALRGLWSKVPIWSRRRALLTRLGQAARGWALAIHNRESPHDRPLVPGDAEAAWRWRQLHDEIARRAGLDEIALTRRLQEVRDTLRGLTAKLIDRMAWREQLGRTDLAARQALQGWADTVRKIGKGTGKRAPAHKARARQLLVQARDAVPVWIMPLARVAESFDPAHARFDVVIVDEASQSDVTGLLAWYLADRIVVVGDHEQVSPLAVGQETGAMQSLISEHLHSIPNHHLYDGTTSIYDLARQSFGGTIALREHFRCVPDIIEFSNELSYNLEIQPLRDPSPVARPHVVEFVVETTDRAGKTNPAEARWIAALMKAATELDAYGGKTMGAITLLGDEQAGLIQDVAVSLIGAVELEGRRFVAGNSAQFQGDERHVIFLSMVDVSTGGKLPIRQTQAFKQRYNVAASRAQDQLWLVHSLDPGRDLQPGDLRRRLIEHIRDPGARRRAMLQAQRRAESPFEVAVIQRLLAAGYQVEPQVRVGGYRIDMVVSDGIKQAALECDGDRFHGVDQIPADMARQAVLERTGWRFIRVRGTRFYRDPEATMAWVFEELRRLEIAPAGQGAGVPPASAAHPLREAVVRRAWEIMREQQWIQAQGVDGAPAHEAS